ncbi:MAG TPA: hypothetical protein VEH75_04900 [Xanthobacteraceae bacterium]|nr:hypothetical protein [Xanthobacteraceae bacterium]
MPESPSRNPDLGAPVGVWFDFDDIPINSLGARSAGNITLGIMRPRDGVVKRSEAQLCGEDMNAGTARLALTDGVRRPYKPARVPEIET